MCLDVVKNCWDIVKVCGREGYIGSCSYYFGLLVDL